ncbi:MAG TPA: NirA family protein [Lacunisphaera sp.]|nr:NirA family protein [Lacunisphaera sp.]
MTAAALPAAGFSPEQKQYLEGFLAALAARTPFVGHTGGGLITATAAEAPANLAAPPAEDTVFGTPLTELSKPERWKYDENPLDIWEKLVAHAEADKFPDEADAFRFKFHGLFHVAPAQNSFMLRLRLPAGELSSHQLHGLADLADGGGGYAHVTTRANLQLREFKPRDIVRVLMRLQELGLTSRGAGADNVRNITASPNSGFDPDELIDVRPFAKGLHHYILNHRHLYGLPRKFNISFDNGGSLAGAADTNDIGFMACRVTEKTLAAGSAGSPNPARDHIAPGIYFRVQLGGITGHGDFARDTGLLVRPAEAVAVAAAMVRVFNENGDRTNRKKARLKYLLEKWGVEKFLDAVQRLLAFPLVRLPLEACEPRRQEVKQGWIGVARQAQPGLNSIGLLVPAGRLSAKQMHQLAELAANYGKGELRCTVWENVIIPHIPDAFVATVRRSLQRIGFATESHPLTGGIISCTGSKGCKYAATDTKGHALALGKVLATRELAIDQPVNFHFTGCPHSCAQHYCGDIGYLGAKLADGSEGYHVVLGGGLGHEQGIAREIFRGVRHTEVPALTERILRTYAERKQPGETFVQWSRRHTVGELQVLFS